MKRVMDGTSFETQFFNVKLITIVVAYVLHYNHLVRFSTNNTHLTARSLPDGVLARTAG